MATNKYSFYQLRVACQQHMMASLYVEPDDPDAFNAGYVEAVTQRHVLLWNVTPWGQPDGWLLRRTEDILQVFMGDDYEVRLQMLVEMQGFAYEALLDPAPDLEDDLQTRMLQAAQAREAIVSVMTAEDTYTGRITYLDDLRVGMDAFDFFGGEDGQRQFPLRDLQMVALDTSEEKMFRMLSEARLKPL